MKKRFSLLSFIGSLLLGMIVLVIAVNCTLLVKGMINKDEIPDIFGYFPLYVQSDSMKDEFETGDLIIVEKAPLRKVRVGDIVSFYEIGTDRSAIVTHRVVDASEKKKVMYYTTRGDANDSDDKDLMSYENYIGIVRFKVDGLGKVMMFFQTTGGMVTAVAAPLFGFVVYDSLRRAKENSKARKENESLKKELEELRKKN